MQKLEIKITGKAKTGKSVIAYLINELLEKEGFIIDWKELEIKEEMESRKHSGNNIEDKISGLKERIKIEIIEEYPKRNFSFTKE